MQERRDRHEDNADQEYRDLLKLKVSSPAMPFPRVQFCKQAVGHSPEATK